MHVDSATEDSNECSFVPMYTTPAGPLPRALPKAWAALRRIQVVWWSSVCTRREERQHREQEHIHCFLQHMHALQLHSENSSGWGALVQQPLSIDNSSAEFYKTGVTTMTRNITLSMVSVTITEVSKAAQTTNRACVAGGATSAHTILAKAETVGSAMTL